MLTTSDKGLNVIKSFEGCALRAYRDSVGVWTIGWGNTNYDANAVKRIGKIGAGVTITQQQADELLEESIQAQYEPSVRSTLKDPTQAQFDAGTSFHYNTGAIKKASWPKNLNAGDMNAARVSILSWNKAGGKVLAGLTRRRQREWAMCERGDYGPEGRQTNHVMITRNEDDNSSTGASAKPQPKTPVGPGMLGLHDTGPEVKELQEQLIELKLLPAGSASGTFDEATELAVGKFQKSHGNLSVDGVVGPATRSAIRRDLDLAAKAKTAGKVIATATVSTGGAAAVVKTAIVWKLLAAFTGVVLVGAGVYLAYRHRDEIMSRFNRLIGREVP